MKKMFQFIGIFCLMVGFIISCPTLAKIAHAGRNKNITAAKPTSSFIATPSRYARLDEDTSWPTTIEELIDYIMNIPFIQNSIAWWEESKVRREERRENWKNLFNNE